MTNGLILVAGGNNSTGVLSNAMLFNPAVMTVLKNPTKLSNGAFQFSFTNTPGALCTVLATGNITLPSSNWTVLGQATEGLTDSGPQPEGCGCVLK